MFFQFNYSPNIDDLDVALSRVSVFLRRHGVQEISSLEVRCEVTRDGKRVVAVNDRLETSRIHFDRESDDANDCKRLGTFPEDAFTLVERVSVSPRRGLSALLHSDE